MTKFLYHYINEVKDNLATETNIAPLADIFSTNSPIIERMAIELDIAENGKEAIILRELNNYYCFYSSTIEDAVMEVKPYGYSQQDVEDVYNKNYTQRRKEIHDYCYGI